MKYLATLKPLSQIMDESDSKEFGKYIKIHHPRSHSHSLTLPMSPPHFGKVVFIKARDTYNHPKRIVYNVYHKNSDDIEHFQAYDCWFTWIAKDKENYLPEDLFEI